MHVKSLRVFCDVVTQRSFSEAAANNGITQSAASQMVNHVEDYLGVKLIDRSTRPFGLTPAGELFYRRCRKMVAQFYSLADKVRSLETAELAQIQVASIYSVGLSHMNQYVKEFLTRYPKSNVRVEYQHPDRVYHLVERGRAHLGLVSYPKSSRTIKAIEWRQERIVLACSPGHFLADRERIGLGDLQGVEVVGYDERLRIAREIDRELAAAGVEAKVVMRFDNTETIKRAVEINAGIGLLPAPTLEREIELGSLIGIPLSEPLTRPLGIIRRRGKEPSVDARHFIQLLLEQASAAEAHDAISASALTSAT